MQSVRSAPPLSKFALQLVHQSEGAPIARVVSWCQGAEYRVWVKAMADQYPVQAYLHRIKQTASAEFPFCSEARETLAHLACVCLLFREGCTAAHNQVHKLILLLLVRCLHNSWELHEETPMANTGLHLNSVSASSMEASGTAARQPAGRVAGPTAGSESTRRAQCCASHGAPATGSSPGTGLLHRFRAVGMVRASWFMLPGR